MPETYQPKSWADPRVEVRTSLIEGKAGFAREAFKQGEIAVIIGGILMMDDEFRAFAATAEQFDAIQIGEDLHLVDLSPDPRSSNGSLNHSCDSNLWMADEVTLVARRDIAPGEELTVDYALFTALPEWELDRSCRCDTSVCRHRITGNDWMLPDVQARYLNHFSPFINARIAKLRLE